MQYFLNVFLLRSKALAWSEQCGGEAGEWRSGTQTGPSISAFPANTGEIQGLFAQDTDVIGINFHVRENNRRMQEVSVQATEIIDINLCIGKNNRKVRDLKFSKSALRKHLFAQGGWIPSWCLKGYRGLYITIERMSSIKMMCHTTK
jgi:hypothetical protein